MEQRYEMLAMEKETLRNLAGPELYLQTGLRELPPQALTQVQGGSVLDVLNNWLESHASAASLVASAVVSALASAVVSGVASAATSSHVAASQVASGVSSLLVGAGTGAQSQVNPG